MEINTSARQTKMRSLNLQCRGFCKVRKKQKALLGKSHLLHFFFFFFNFPRFSQVQTETLPGPAGRAGSEGLRDGNSEGPWPAAWAFTSHPSHRKTQKNSGETPQPAGKGAAHPKGGFLGRMLRGHHPTQGLQPL